MTTNVFNSKGGEAFFLKDFFQNRIKKRHIEPLLDKRKEEVLDVLQKSLISQLTGPFARCSLFLISRLHLATNVYHKSRFPSGS
jgi:hypothetical protein